jgi:hypothetical protein
MEWGSESQPAACSSGTTYFRQVSASEGTWRVPVRIVQIAWVGPSDLPVADGTLRHSSWPCGRWRMQL